MSAREKLRTLLGLPEGKYLTDVEMQIEYETELAHTEAYRRWLEKTHDEWVQETKGEPVVEPSPIVQQGNMMDPKTIDVEFLNLSNKATMNLRKIGINSLYDCVNHTEEELNKLLGLKPTKTVEISLERYGLTLKSANASVAEPENSETEEDEGTDGEKMMTAIPDTEADDKKDEEKEVSEVNEPVADSESQTEETAEAEATEVSLDETKEEPAEIYIPDEPETALPEEETPAPVNDEVADDVSQALLDAIPDEEEKAVEEESVADTSVNMEVQAEAVQEEVQEMIDIPQEQPKGFTMANDGLDDDPEEEYGSMDPDERDTAYGDVEVIDLGDSF